MIKPTHLRQAFRIFRTSVRRKLKGTTRYKGSAEEICRHIVNKCWNENKEYFQTSAGHFCEFYSRDFGWCCKSLIELGYSDECENTLDYAMDIFSRKGGIKTTITPYDKPVDIYHYAPDSLGFILRSISLLKSKRLEKKYKDFLNSEIHKFHNTVVEKETGLVRKDRQFSSMKDYSKRKSSCYDNVMVWTVKNAIEKIRMLDNPFEGYSLKSTVKDELWNGSYFYDDLKKQGYVAGDANVFPFWTGMFTSREMAKRAVASIQKEELDYPMPLSYTSPKVKTKMILHEFVVSGYEQSTIWAHMGPLFIEVVSRISKEKARDYLLQYKKVIERYGNYLEIFDRNLKPYQTPFYYSDESMLWASNYLALSKKLFK